MRSRTGRDRTDFVSSPVLNFGTGPYYDLQKTLDQIAIRCSFFFWDRTISQSPKNSGPDCGAVQSHFLGPDCNVSLRH